MDLRHFTATAPALSPDGRLVAAGYEDSTYHILYIWDTFKKTIRFELKEQPSRINSVAFSPDGSTLASASDDGMVRLWNPNTGKIKRVITGFLDNVGHIEFTPDGRGLIVSVADQPDVLYNLASGKTSPAPVPTLDPLEKEMLQDAYLLAGGGSKILFSPDGKNVAVGHGSIQIWDVQTRQLLRAISNDQPLSITGMTYSPDGQHLAVIDADGNVFAWNVLSGQCELSLSAQALATGQVLLAIGGEGLGPGIGAGVMGEQGIAFSPDGKSLALGNGAAVEVWDVASASKLWTLEQTQPASLPTSVSFSADGRFIYAALNRNRDAAVWDAATGKLLRRLDLPRVDPNAFTAIALRGPLFARNNYVENNTWIELWDLDKGQMTKLPTPQRETEPLRFSADGRFFMALVDHSRVYIWRVDTGQLVFISDDSFDVGDLALGPDGKMLATADYGKVSLWDLAPYTGAASAANFVPPAPPPSATPYVSDDTYPTATPQPTQALIPLPLPTLQPGAITAGNAAQLRQQARFGNGDLAQVTWAENGILLTSSQGVYLYDAQTLAETRRFEPERIACTQSRLLPDGRLLVAGATVDNKVQVWDAASNKMLVELPGTGEPALSPDGKWLVYAGDTGGLGKWNLETGQAGVLLRSQWYTLHWPVFSPDGTRVAAIQSDRSIRVWDLATGAILDGVGGPDTDITDMSFSADGNYVVGAAGGSAWVWSLKPSLLPLKFNFYEGQVAYNMTLYQNTVSAAVMDAAASQVAIGTTEHTIWVYDHQTARVRAKLEGDTGAPIKLAFSPDGSRLLSVDRDGKMILWDIAAHKPLVTSLAFRAHLDDFVIRQDGRISAWGENTIWTFNPADANLEQAVPVTGGKILAVSPAGDLAAAYSPLKVSLYDATTGALKQTLPEEAKDVFVEYYYEGQILRQFYGAVFSPDGKRLATLGAGGFWLYSLPDGKQTGYAEGNNTRSAAFSPDGDWLVASLAEIGYRNAPELFDARNAASLFSLDASDNFAQNRISPDKRWIGSVTNEWEQPSALVIVDASAGQRVKRLPFEKVKLVSLAFNPDVSLVAVGQADGKVVLVDFETMKIVATFEAHKGPVTSLAFLPDGRSLISAGQDGVVKIWTVP